MSVEDKVRSYILENYLFTADQSELNNDDSFLEKGIIDSTGILEIIFLPERVIEVDGLMVALDLQKKIHPLINICVGELCKLRDRVFSLQAEFVGDKPLK